jgi:hypothetical protein
LHAAQCKNGLECHKNYSVHLRTVWNWRSYNFQSHSRAFFNHLAKAQEADQGAIWKANPSAFRIYNY